MQHSSSTTKLTLLPRQGVFLTASQPATSNPVQPGYTRFYPPGFYDTRIIFAYTKTFKFHADLCDEKCMCNIRW